MGWLDISTGPDYGFSLFYLLPIVVAGWVSGRTAGLLVALQAAAWWLGAALEDAGGVLSLPAAWNGLTRVVIYVAMGWGAALLRHDRERLRLLLGREETLSRTDPLTGLLNARAFHEALAVDLARATREQRTLSVVFLDLDDFKWVNDNLGHARGDHVLIEVAGTIRSGLRTGDRAARLGGDEFAVLLWGTSETGAAGVAARLVRAIGKLAASMPGSRLGASAGVAGSERAPADAARLLALADAAMYVAKERGKGGVAVASEPDRQLAPQTD
jgi:diguanylate cyclase (GGDEF)-like protein